MERTSAAAPVPARPFQFTIRSLMWLMVTLAMVLAFVRPAESLRLGRGTRAGRDPRQLGRRLVYADPDQLAGNV